MPEAEPARAVSTSCLEARPRPDFVSATEIVGKVG
jgi:hypothetical protein